MSNGAEMTLIEEEEAQVAFARLEQIAEEFWGNAILYRLAEALGYEKDEHRVITVEPDDVLDEAVEIIRQYREGDY